MTLKDAVDLMASSLSESLRRSKETTANGYVELGLRWEGVTPQVAGVVMRQFTRNLSFQTEMLLGEGAVEINNWRAWWHAKKGASNV